MASVWYTGYMRCWDGLASKGLPKTQPDLGKALILYPDCLILKCLS